MARTPEPHSATSQFFINQVDNPGFDFGEIGYGGSTAYYKVGYCVFGRVLSPMSVVNAIANLETEIVGGPTDERPDVDVIIESATVTLEAPFCTEKLDGDFDGDCDSDTDDIIKFAIQWMSPTCRGCYTADTNDDGEVNFADFAKISNNWLKCNSITTPCN